MELSKSQEESRLRLSELARRQKYMNAFIGDMMTIVNAPQNEHVLKSAPYYNLSRRLKFIHEMRDQTAARGNELSAKARMTREDLEELHSIRIIDSGHIDCIWICVKEFLAQTGIDMIPDERRI